MRNFFGTTITILIKQDLIKEGKLFEMERKLDIFSTLAKDLQKYLKDPKFGSFFRFLQIFSSRKESEMLI